MTRIAGEAEQWPPSPCANPRLLGQDEAEARLLKARSRGRLPHAWLLTGPRGVGKATLAFRFARHLLADAMPAVVDDLAGGPGLFGETPSSPADSLAIPEDHPVFRRVAAGGHADLQVVERGVDPKSGKLRRDITVDDVRGLIHFLHLTASEGGWRIAIVDSADEMNANAANALLKVLEEPPDRALLLLVSHRPGRLLPTIRSRCQRLALAPLPETDVAALLVDYAPGIDPGEAAALARLSDGSIGRALELADGGGLELYRQLLDLLGELPDLNVVRLHDFAEGLSRDASGAAFRTAAELLTAWLARALRTRVDGMDEAAEIVEGENAVAGRLLTRRSLADWLALWENLSRLFAMTEAASLDRKQAMITAFVRIQSLAA